MVYSIHVHGPKIADRTRTYVRHVRHDKVRHDIDRGAIAISIEKLIDNTVSVFFKNTSTKYSVLEYSSIRINIRKPINHGESK